MNRRVKPLKASELIDQDHLLFIGKFFSSEARLEHGEIRGITNAKGRQGYIRAAFTFLV